MPTLRRAALTAEQAGLIGGGRGATRVRRAQRLAWRQARCHYVSGWRKAHKFRHTFARTWLERGGELYSLSRLMGHSSVKVTEIYLEDFQSRQARLQHSKYSPLGQFKPPQTGRRRYRYKRQPHMPDEESGGDT